MPLDLHTFPGLSDALANTPQTSLEHNEIEDDVAAEQETLPSPAIPPEDSQGNTNFTNDLAQLQDTLKHISKGISDSTESEYIR